MKVNTTTTVVHPSTGQALVVSNQSDGLFNHVDDPMHAAVCFEGNLYIACFEHGEFHRRWHTVEYLDGRGEHIVCDICGTEMKWIINPENR